MQQIYRREFTDCGLFAARSTVSSHNSPVENPCFVFLMVSAHDTTLHT
ncbi:hypothetical protein Z949_2739 [Sulfitobacter guttiformis KCTC 32187]|nr:hypothetical protein Z949_2739 [Sulfitobacter guttiformis KCTC 32187]